MSEGYFTDASMIRVVQRERIVDLAGPRRVFMQAAHPLAVKAFVAHTDMIDKLYERFARLAAALAVIAFGSREDADETTDRIRRAHSRVRGTLHAPVGRYPAGTSYRADQPDLMLWILFSVVDSDLTVYSRYVRPMSRDQEAAYWEDYKLVGELLGMDRSDLPDSLGDLDDYRREMLTGDALLVTDWARETVERVIFGPPLSWRARPLMGVVKPVTIGLLPDRIRREYGFSETASQVGRLVGATAERCMRRGVLPLMPSRVRRIQRLEVS